LIARYNAKGTIKRAMIILRISCMGTLDIPTPITKIDTNKINMYFPRCNVDKWNICGLLFIFLDKLPVGANIAKIIEVLPS
jgi:hypothetical protein